MRKKPLILVADDSPHIRDALSARLLQSGFEVASASSANSAIEQFDRRNPDAAILDVEMADSDGFAVCEHIRECGSAIPVLILTGSDSRILRANLDLLTTTVGADHFVVKPYDGRTLITMLHGLVGDHN